MWGQSIFLSFIFIPLTLPLHLFHIFLIFNIIFVDQCAPTLFSSCIYISLLSLPLLTFPTPVFLSQRIYSSQISGSLCLRLLKYETLLHYLIAYLYFLLFSLFHENCLILSTVFDYSFPCVYGHLVYIFSIISIFSSLIILGWFINL